MIKLYGNMFIDTDDYNWILFKSTKRTDKKTGEVKERNQPIAYHSSLADCLETAREQSWRRLARKKKMELDGIIEELKKLDSEFLANIKEI